MNVTLGLNLKTLETHQVNFHLRQASQGSLPQTSKAKV